MSSEAEAQKKMEELEKFARVYWDIISLEPEDPNWRNGSLNVIEQFRSTGGDLLQLTRMLKGRARYHAIHGDSFEVALDWYADWLYGYFEESWY
jgi:hypothetical protein